MKPQFKMTYEVVTDDSASHGDAAYRGFLPRSGEVPLHRNNMPKRPSRFTLRQVIDLMGGMHCEADSCPCAVPSWLTVCRPEREDGTHAFYTKGPGNNISLSVHLDDVSPASARRVARLLNCYGLTK